MTAVGSAVAAPSPAGLTAPKKDSAGRALKDCLAGSFGGIVQVLSGQPFDTIKVRMQTSSQYPSAFAAVKATYQQEGFRAFYKGTATPLVGVGACVSIQFFALEAAKRAFARANREAGSHNPAVLSTPQLFTAGAIAGIANSVVSGPVEHIRTRLQVQGPAPAQPSPGYFTGPIDAIRKIGSAHGIAGIYKGQAVTLLRESLGYGIYFATYEWLVQRKMSMSGLRRDELPAPLLCAYGAFGGIALWMLVFPVDAVKSKLQTDGFGADRRYTSALDCARKTIRSEGVAGLYRGFSPCMLRSAPVNGLTFVAFELAMNVLGRD